MNRTIVDLTNPPKKEVKLTPIHLEQCLQDVAGPKKFIVLNGPGGFDYFLARAQKITRLTTLRTDQYSFSAKERDLIEVDGCIFLGKWNDGVVEWSNCRNLVDFG